MTTLFDVSGIRARIFTLPNRPPFMISADLAEVYDTSVKALNQAVSRNPERFPEDFCFFLEAEKIDPRWSQSVTTSGFRSDLKYPAFTHAGALMLSAVLRTETAAQVSVIVHRAFAAMEQAALVEVQHRLARLQSEARGRRPIRSRIVDAAREGWTFDQLWKDGNWSRAKLAEAVADCVALGLIDRPLPGGPARQADLFSNG